MAETGFIAFDRDVWRGHEAYAWLADVELPPCGATPDGLVLRPAGAAPAQASDAEASAPDLGSPPPPGSTPGPALAPDPHLIAGPLRTEHPGPASVAGSDPGPPPMAEPTAQLPGPGRSARGAPSTPAYPDPGAAGGSAVPRAALELLEVKTVCPFVEAKRSRSDEGFLFADPGPHLRVPAPAYVQMQWQMFVTGAAATHMVTPPLPPLLPPPPPPCAWSSCGCASCALWHRGSPPGAPGDVLERKGRPQRRLDRWLEEVAGAVGGG